MRGIPDMLATAARGIEGRHFGLEPVTPAKSIGNALAVRDKEHLETVHPEPGLDGSRRGLAAVPSDSEVSTPMIAAPAVHQRLVEIHVVLVVACHRVTAVSAEFEEVKLQMHLLVSRSCRDTKENKREYNVRGFHVSNVILLDWFLKSQSKSRFSRGGSFLSCTKWS